MKIFFLGDTHGNIHLVEESIERANRERCDRIVQVGDFGFFPYIYPNFLKELEYLESDIPIYWIDGNHENHEHLKDYKYSSIPTSLTSMGHKGNNIYYIPRGYTESIASIKILYLGGADSVDKHSRTPGRDWWPEEAIKIMDYYICSQESNVDIMVTHDCPQNKVMTHENIGSREALNQLVNRLKPKLLIHGHHHYSYRTLDKLGITIGLGIKGEDNYFILDL